jgi:subtilisin
MTDVSNRVPEPQRPQPTGRTLVVFKPGVDMRAAASDLHNTTGVRALSSREVSGASLESVLSKGDSAVYFERFKVCVMAAGASERFSALGVLESVRETRPEYYMFAIDDLQQRYNEWVRSGLRLLADASPQALGAPAGRMAGDSALATGFTDTNELSWGLVAVGASRSTFTGRGVRVAVLDTGIDQDHPDFIGRPIQTRSFVGGTAADVQGHGTHTAGTIAGPLKSKIGRRHGVAPEVDLHVGKVLNDGGSGREGDIIDGINWAIDQKCAVISMSLGRATSLGEKPDPLYEEVGAAALREGSMIIAAAGNESNRDAGRINPVGAPANSPSIFAVAAVDPVLAVAPFSCGGLNAEGGEVNIAGPGVSVYSSFPRPRLSRVLAGTSMACPHVAGVAAL